MIIPHNLGWGERERESAVVAVMMMMVVVVVTAATKRWSDQREKERREIWLRKSSVSQISN